MPTELVFVDIETTGLDPERHSITELAYAVNDGDIHTLRLPHKLVGAEPKALEVSRYHERGLGDVTKWTRAAATTEFHQALKGNTLVAANPAFDAGFISRYLRATPWHYRLLDVEAYAAGALGLTHPFGLAATVELMQLDGHDLPDPDHTAAGDVAAARAVYYTALEINGGDS